MKNSLRWAVPAAALGVAALAFALPGSASAATSTSYQANLKALNHATGSGDFMLMLDGSTATITEHVTGLAATFSSAAYPHVQHIHIGAKGQCPTTAADTNKDGVISTTEGGPAYGAIGTTLSTSGDTSPKAGTTLTVAPSGGSFTYSRSFTLDSATLSSIKAGTAVIVVHGLDPATLSPTAQAEKSDLVPSLPLAATSPALCGVLTASQMSSMPGGAPQTGGGSTSGIEDQGVLFIGGGLLASAGTAFALRRRVARQS
ncbi:hypothetical protein SAMN05892883_1612 [Jatrophihabitans sp. GAS493]|uniref:hypothetical protein n=1 Tax=Jatrophihabitans sp. GAS493 TaxID=1907575 RepID=UPI000BB83B4B|nr:hypothetical protein [Jatrophihabitans sp. GAS493]SOD72191.1 hypothetical protein SAMN05892883_1612 [Jatrophihabitans sp. GAS493]